MAIGVLGTAVSGLRAFQRSLETTGHNIANANTEGYSRQKVELTQLQPNYLGNDFLGQGVDVANISRSYDQFLTAQLRSSTSVFGDVDQYNKLASQIDNFLADPASGLSPVMKDFFSAANKVANDPSSTAARNVLLSNADTLAQRFNSMNSRFQGLDTQVSKELTSMTEEVNTYATSIADLNTKISAAVAGSQGIHQPNDLLDQRDRLLGKLSALVDVSVVSQPNGMTSVFVGKGQPLVLDDTSNSLQLAASVDNPQQLDITLKTPSTNQVITSQIVGGTIGGTLRFRDEVLAPEAQHLKNIAETFVSEVNQLHRAGFDLDGGTGNDLLTVNAESGELSVAITDPRQLAAATDAGSVPGDNRNALALANLENTAVAFQQDGVATGMTTTFQGAYEQIVSKVGSLTRAANLSKAAQETLLNNARSAVESVSGVNLDEEAANLMRYQQAYQASAQAISISNGLFESLLGAVR